MSTKKPQKYKVSCRFCDKRIEVLVTNYTQIKNHSKICKACRLKTRKE